MEKFLTGLLDHPVGILVVVLIVVATILKRSQDLAVLILSLLEGSKNKKVALVADIAVGIFNLVEKAIPDDIKNKSLAKIDDAMEQFINAWKKRTGKSPSKQIEEWARDKFAALAYDHKVGRHL